MTHDDFRAARLRLGMTQATLAEALGYSHAHVVSAIETGNRNPGPAAIKLLERLLREREAEE